MEVERCLVCSKSGAKKCGKCKSQFYCSKECQKKNWNDHKRFCREITQLVRNSGEDTDEEFLETKRKMVSMALSQRYGREFTHKVPKYHEEYRRLYPEDRKHYERLQENWKMANYIDEANIDMPTSPENFASRWKPFYGGFELHLFLKNEPKPGDIFSGRPVYDLSYGGTITQLNQSMRNAPAPKVQFYLGHTYVSVGFVDMFQLLVGDFVPQKKGEMPSKPLSYICYDKSDIVVARNHIIYEMILQGVYPESILQVWFSAGWNEKTQKDFRKCCKSLLERTDFSENQSLKNVVNHWATAEIGVTSASTKWLEIMKEYAFEPLKNLCHQIDRTDYARYLLTGCIFGQNDEYVHGNVSIFCPPGGFENHWRCEENFFAALAMDDLRYEKSLMNSVTEKLTKDFEKLGELVTTKQLICKFFVRDLKVTDKVTLGEIKALNAKMIDWSNIPDYLPIDDFFTMAKACNGTDTMHSVHYMNWVYLVFGTSLYDYEDKNGTYKVLKEEMVQKYQTIKKDRPFLRQDQYLRYYMNTAGKVLCEKYRKNFIEYISAGKNVVFSEPTSEEFNPFERNTSCFYTSFTFNTN